MRVMVIVKANAESEAGVLPSEQLLSEMTTFNEELTRAGVMKAGEGLRPSSHAKRVRFTGRNRTVIDGPFAESKELIAGYWLWEVASMDEAVAWAKRIPNPDGDGEVEIRPLFEVADLGDALTPELAARDRALRDATSQG